MRFVKKEGGDRIDLRSYYTSSPQFKRVALNATILTSQWWVSPS